MKSTALPTGLCLNKWEEISGTRMGRNEDFHDICDELADAEKALLAIYSVPSAARADRRVEWEAVSPASPRMVTRSAAATSSLYRSYVETNLDSDESDDVEGHNPVTDRWRRSQ